MTSRLAQLGRWVAFGVVLVLLAVPARADVPPPVTLTILHINDVYEIDGLDGGRVGGLARVATLADRLRRRGPILFTLGGDYLSPSPIGTARVDGQSLGGRQMVDVLNATGLQWAVLGNHEFDQGDVVLRARLAESRFGVVASNISDLTGTLFPGTVESRIVSVRVGGRTLRIGLIGLTIDTPPRSFVRYGDPIARARALVATMKGRTDAIVALTHLALAADHALAQAVPEIDVILGGHEHENSLTQRGANFTPIIKADANARTAAIVSLVFERAGERPVISSRLQPIDARIPSKPVVAQLTKRWTDAAFEGFRRDGFSPDRVVATLPETLEGREAAVRTRVTNLGDLLLAAMMRETGLPDLAVNNSGSIRIDDELPAGPVTEYDMIRVLPFGGKLVTASIQGDLLIDVLDAGRANVGTGGFLHVFGAASMPTGWTIAGQPINPMGRYRVVMPEFLLTGGEARLGFLTRSNPQVQDVREYRDIRLALIDELKRRYP